VPFKKMGPHLATRALVMKDVSELERVYEGGLSTP